MQQGLLIVLEGVDGSGKTTLADTIMKEAMKQGYAAEYFHCTYWNNVNIRLHQSQVLLKAIKVVESGGVAVIDRLWASEAIYANAYRGGSTRPLLGRMIDRIVLKYSGIYVLCVPHPEAHKIHFENLRKMRQEMYSSVEVARVAFHRYAHGLKTVSDNRDLVDYCVKAGGALSESDRAVKYDLFSDNVVHTAIRILDKAKRFAKDQINEITDTPTVSGHASLAQYGVMGTPGSIKQRYQDFPAWPFFEYTPRSENLAYTKAVHELKRPETDFIYCDTSSPKNSLIGVDKVVKGWIALGPYACSKLINNGISEKRIRDIGSVKLDYRFVGTTLQTATKLNWAIKELNNLGG